MKTRVDKTSHYQLFITHKTKTINFKTSTMRQKLTLIATAGFLTLGAAILFSACKKDSDNTASDADQATAVSISSSGTVSESLYDDAFDVVTQEGENNSVSGKVNSCATVTLSPADTTS